MRLPFKGSRPTVPAAVSAALDLGRGEHVLAVARTLDDSHVVITTHRFVVVDPAGQAHLSRPWHLVDGGAWDQASETLRVTWVSAPPTSFRLRADQDFHGAFRERVQATVVLEEFVEFGPRLRARAAIRRDLATGDLVEQVITGRGVSIDDPQVRQACEAALLRLREQIGLD